MQYNGKIRIFVGKSDCGLHFFYFTPFRHHDAGSRVACFSGK